MEGSSVPWRTGMATSCQHCQSDELAYDDQGVARCARCGGTTLPAWAPRDAKAVAPTRVVEPEPRRRPPGVIRGPRWWQAFLAGVVLGALVAAAVSYAARPPPLPDVAITAYEITPGCSLPGNVSHYTFDFWIANFGRRNAEPTVQFAYANRSATIAFFVPAVTSLHAAVRFNATVASAEDCGQGPAGLSILSVLY